MQNNRCYKCGEEVEINNSVDIFEKEMSEYWGIFNKVCHLAPTEKCPGSPSRFQFITGIPNTRSEYASKADKMDKFRNDVELVRDICCEYHYVYSLKCPDWCLCAKTRLDDFSIIAERLRKWREFFLLLDLGVARYA